VTYGGVGDNEDMVDKVVDLIDQITPEDIICIGWTTTLRFRLVKGNKWFCVFPNMIPDTDLLSEKTVEELIINRGHELYKDALVKRIKLINKALPDNLIVHWSWDCDNEFMFETISAETKREIHDHHWSENGNEDFATWLIGKIEENKSVILV
jgi:hypothetical protein